MPKDLGRFALGGAVAAGVVLTPGIGNATPPSGVSGVIISKVTFGGHDYVDPAGSPLSEDAPNPGCDFQ